MGSVVEVEAYLQISHSHSICSMENLLHSSGNRPALLGRGENDRHCYVSRLACVQPVPGMVPRQTQIMLRQRGPPDHC
jgi:hypothetical protein